ncbi:MAG TPA: glutathione S-transferase family protein [Povalibacter sp.]
MQLHTTNGAPNGRKVAAVIEHLHLDVEFVYHDLFAGALQRPEYLTINANSKVPALVDGDFVLWESNAIMQYLADKAGDERLLPRDARARADVTRWQLWESAHFNAAFGALAFETFAKPRVVGSAPDETIVAVAMSNLARFAAVLERYIEGRRFLVGTGLTLADYAVLTFEEYRGLTPFDWSPFPQVNAYFDRLRELPAWIRTSSKRAPSDTKAA